MDQPDLYAQLAWLAEGWRDHPPSPTAVLGDEPILLYGAGNVGAEARRLLTAKGWNVSGFLDRKAAPGTQAEGLPVLLPEDPSFDEAVRREALVIVTIFNPLVDLPALLERLRGLGWRRVMPYVAFHRHFAGELADRFWLTGPAYYAGQAARMRAGAVLWSDVPSRALYDALLRHRLEADPALLPAPAVETQYFPPGLPEWKTPGRFVDCGAYDGDTLEQMRATGFPLAAVAAFEPDAANLRRLGPRLAEWAAEPGGPETLLWPCAVSSHTTPLRFEAGQGTGSGLAAGGNTVVQAVALDEALAGFRPTLIKMDIEGAEHEALLGARRLVERHRPGLAICLYHCPQHVWQIPLLIQSWNLGYRFFLRLHGHHGLELVLYAHADA